MKIIDIRTGASVGCKVTNKLNSLRMHPLISSIIKVNEKPILSPKKPQKSVPKTEAKERAEKQYEMK